MVKRTDNQQEVGFSPHHIGNPFITANREEILCFGLLLNWYYL